VKTAWLNISTIYTSCHPNCSAGVGYIIIITVLSTSFLHVNQVVCERTAR